MLRIECFALAKSGEVYVSFSDRDSNRGYYRKEGSPSLNRLARAINNMLMMEPGRIELDRVWRCAVGWEIRIKG